MLLLPLVSSWLSLSRILSFLARVFLWKVFCLLYRLSYEGQKFEILVKPDQALEFKLGKRTDITSVLISEDIYTDSSKGNKPSDDMLTKAFKTNDTTKIAEIILKKGDLNLTTAQRRKMMDEKRKQIIEYIAKTYVDPRSHLPHPPLRIEQAMTDARVSIDPQKSADDQIKDIVDGLRGIIPLKSENIDLIITVPAQYAAQSYSVLKSSGTLKKEEWLSNGSLKAILEV